MRRSHEQVFLEFVSPKWFEAKLKELTLLRKMDEITKMEDVPVVYHM